VVCAQPPAWLQANDVPLPADSPVAKDSGVTPAHPDRDRDPAPVEPRRLVLDAPHATAASVAIDIRLYHLLPAGKSWRFTWPDRPLHVPPFGAWTLETVRALLQEVATWRPDATETPTVTVELVGWRFQSRYPRFLLATPTWRARIALQGTGFERTGGGDEHEYGFGFSDPMIAVFAELHARSPFVVPPRPAPPALSRP
jgi:hypothetical protein